MFLSYLRRIIAGRCNRKLLNYKLNLVLQIRSRTVNYE